MAINLDNVHSQWRLNFRSRLIQRIGSYLEFINTLESNDIFDAKLFRRFRQGTLTQGEWGNLTNVSQGTIGNWERGVTYPNRAYRKSLLSAAKQVLEYERRRVDRLSGQLGITAAIDPISTQESLDSSILRASLTDFDFDDVLGRVVAVPFASDERFDPDGPMAEDKANLLSSLSEQADIIISGLERGINGETDRLCDYFERYGKHAVSVPTNPRLLHRIGETIAKRTASDDVRMAISDWDDTAIDGFNSDHVELMRLYYREALARAQEVEAAEFDDESGNGHASFYRIADLLGDVKGENDQQIFDEDISTLLRDIGREIRDLEEAETFSSDETRKVALRRRRREALKNGSIFVGRILFFSSLFIVMSPAALGAAGSIASILGLVEAAAPGSVLEVYERLRSAFPILPKLKKDK